MQAHAVQQIDEVGEDPVAIGDEIGEFRVVGKLARGSYRALEYVVTRRVELHIEGPDLAIDVRGLDSFDHPGMARIAAHGVSQAGLSWIATELVAGTALDELLARGALPDAEALHVISYVADVLSAAHRAGVPHGALTDRSVTLVSDTRAYPVCVRDWGLRPRDRSNTAESFFTAPEGTASLAGDIYALGAIAYRALGGSAPPDLARLVDRMLAVDPDERPSAAEVVALAYEVSPRGFARPRWTT